MSSGGGENALLPHLERFLGPYAGDGIAEPEWNVAFSAFRWRDTPTPGVDTLVSFGLARHVFDTRRQEVVLVLRRRWEEVALATLVSIGTYLLDRHAPLDVGETVRIPQQLETPVELLEVTSADELAPGLGLCAEYSPPVDVVWLRPRGGGDAYDLDTRES